jgi:hypothetical protein
MGKSNKKECKNYTGSSLLSMHRKVYGSVIVIERVSEITEVKIKDELIKDMWFGKV